METPLERLERVLSRLPGVGKRSAERMALKLVRNNEQLIPKLIEALQHAEAHVACCEVCGNITTVELDPCKLCRDPKRNAHFLCVVEEPGDIALIERAARFTGRYFCLLGKFSPMHGDNLENTRLKRLIDRIRDEEVTELLLALNSDVESEATAAYLTELLSGYPVKLTRLALGIPAGSGLAYSDPVTLSRAIDGRQEL